MRFHLLSQAIIAGLCLGCLAQRAMAMETQTELSCSSVSWNSATSTTRLSTVHVLSGHIAVGSQTAEGSRPNLLLELMQSDGRVVRLSFQNAFPPLPTGWFHGYSVRLEALNWLGALVQDAGGAMVDMRDVQFSIFFRPNGLDVTIVSPTPEGIPTRQIFALNPANWTPPNALRLSCFGATFQLSQLSVPLEIPAEPPMSHP